MLKRFDALTGKLPVDLKIFIITFAAIFLAELGDKTQLATFAFAASNAQAKWIVFLGAAAALTSTSLLGVLLGGIISKYVPAVYLRVGAGILFILIGVVFLLVREKTTEAKYGRYLMELEHLRGNDQCRTCARFQDMLDHLQGDPDLKRAIARYRKGEQPERHAPLGCGDCNTMRLMALYEEEKDG